MKKTLLVLLILLAVVTLAACGGGEAEETTKYGVLSFSAAEDEDIQGWFEENEAKSLLHEEVNFDSMSAMLLALSSQRINYMGVPDIVASYIVQRDEDMSATPGLMIYGLQMAVPTDDTELRDQLNAALTTLRDNGVLDELAEEWIYDLPAGEEPAAGEIPVIEGAPTVKVGVTGDLPPLDYVSADGQPGGYNVALLSALGELMQVNFELVTVDCNARATALESGIIDMVFWMISFGESAAGLEQAGLQLTNAYFGGNFYLVTYKTPAEELRDLLGLDEARTAFI